ncbi:hypothetical protein ACFVEN_21370 [Streptomyces sp. NPDC057681]|uniref:hypothetical protein n=1 Tax=Streptomyces sp. NPDC057681 TaxID=3346209 RepID=UPI00369B5251
MNASAGTAADRTGRTISTRGPTPSYTHPVAGAAGVSTAMAPAESKGTAAVGTRRSSSAASSAPVTAPTTVADAPSEARSGPVTERAPSCTKSARRLTVPNRTTNHQGLIAVATWVIRLPPRRLSGASAAPRPMIPRRVGSLPFDTTLKKVDR